MTQLFQSTYDGYINLVTFDLRPEGDDIYGFVDSSTFVSATPQLSTITWQGLEYVPLAFSTSGYERGGQSLVKPKVSLPDPGALMYITLNKFNSAMGATVIRYQALAADILANNPYGAIMEEHYLLNNVSFDGFTLECELATHLDYQRSQFPAHIMYRSEYPGIGSQLAD